jgi:hypothetical protein
MFEITMLPARQGDAIWVRWGEENDPHQMMIDMGTEEVGNRIRNDLLNLPASQRTIDLLVVSHVDRDHIGGVLTCLAEADPIPGLEIKDVWFNGFQHLSGGSVAQPDVGDSNGLEPMGPAQGERLSSWLRKQVWNKAFDGSPVQRIPGEVPKTVTLHDDMRVTVLGPTPARLEAFIDTWVEEVELALEKGTLTEVSPGLEPMGSKTPPLLEEEDDLEFLAETDNSADDSKPNGSSIVLLLEYKDGKVLLSGDAFSADLVEGLQAVSGDERMKLDAFKLPHHCSRNNVFKPLVETVDCERWLISTDGSQFRHPDAVALARVITYSKIRSPNLFFNVPSTFNGWWDNKKWKQLYDYITQYGSEEGGLTVPIGSDQ